MSNFNYNRVILGGRIANAVELKSTPGGVSLVSLSIAVKRRGQREGEPQSDFVQATAFRGTAEFIARYFQKGSSICIDGRLQTRSWVDDKGAKRYATEVIISEAYFVEARRDASPSQPGAKETPAPVFTEVDTIEDLPF